MPDSVLKTATRKHRGEVWGDKWKKCPLLKPTLKMVITATEYGYRRDDGVLVIPVGCLKH